MIYTKLGKNIVFEYKYLHRFKIHETLKFTLCSKIKSVVCTFQGSMAYAIFIWEVQTYNFFKNAKIYIFYAKMFH